MSFKNKIKKINGNNIINNNLNEWIDAIEKNYENEEEKNRLKEILKAEFKATKFMISMESIERCRDSIDYYKEILLLLMPFIVSMIFIVPIPKTQIYFGLYILIWCIIASFLIYAAIRSFLYKKQIVKLDNEVTKS